MEVIKTNIDGVVIIEPKIFKDSRGYFFESYNKKDFDEKVAKVDFVQDNESCSTYGVMRGLHFQRPPFAQAKLVRCVKGAVLDVAVDIRKGSPTYANTWQSNLPKITTISSSFQEVSHMALQSSVILRYSNTSVIIITTLRQTAEYPSLTKVLELIGRLTPPKQFS